jgi:hypothetical protein
MTLKLDFANYAATKYACVNFHYSKTVPAGKLIKIGVWEHNKFIGVVLYGRGANSTLGAPYGLSQTQCCELVRIALTNHETPVSRIVAISFKLLKQISPGIKLIVSFADTNQNHHGGIYQAGNWIYSGQSNAADEYLVNGLRMHGRSMRAKYGSHVGKDFIKIVKGSVKHRYLMPLCDSIRADILNLSKQYPKRVTKANSSDQLESGGAIPTNALHI